MNAPALSGVSLLDYFAAQALAGMMSRHSQHGPVEWQTNAAWAAYSIARAMLAERAKAAGGNAPAKATHTPAPWSAFTDDSGASPHTNIVAVKPVTACIASLPGRHKREPDIAVMAAAAELLEALKFASRVLTDNGIRCMVGETDVVKAALSKAEPAQ